jgi:hypothetical protein
MPNNEVAAHNTDTPPTYTTPTYQAVTVMAIRKLSTVPSVEESPAHIVLRAIVLVLIMDTVAFPQRGCKSTLHGS